MIIPQELWYSTRVVVWYCIYSDVMEIITVRYRFLLGGQYPDEVRPLFVDSGVRLTAQDLRALYLVEFSDMGANFRASEEDTIFCFESFLFSCEGEREAIKVKCICQCKLHQYTNNVNVRLLTTAPCKHGKHYVNLLTCKMLLCETFHNLQKDELQTLKCMSSICFTF